MKQRAWLAALATIGVLLGGCGSNPRPQMPAVPFTPPPTTPANPPAAPVTQAPVDPVAALITLSQGHFLAGERELKVGHLESARAEFDRAIDVLLESPYGARTDARLREHFDRLVDRINAYEVTALTQGDGFSEKRDEPASIDELLAIATFPKPDPGPFTTEAVKEDLASNVHDVPIAFNAKVLGYVELFQSKLRDYIQESLSRGSSYLPMIQNVFRAEGLPLDLAFIPIVESGFKTNAVSKATARGPWQFMKATAIENGLKHDWFVDERSDPEKATVAAAKYLKTLATMFDGDWNLVLAAYNGGLGRVQRAVQRAGTTDFWQLSGSSRYLPKETREYVPLILAAIIVAKNPAQYGFDVVAAGPVAYDNVTVSRPIDLRRVAEWTGASIDEIQSLNPSLRRWTTPIKAEDFQLKVPAGTGDVFQAKLLQASTADLAALKWYTVRKGETLSTIARKLKVGRTDLAEANGLSTKSRVVAGQELVIPRAPATLLATRTERAAPVVVASRSLGGPADIPTPAGPKNPVVYRVKRGDTLFSIARLFDTTVENLKAWNRLHSSAISAGARLKIFSSRSDSSR